MTVLPKPGSAPLSIPPSRKLTGHELNIPRRADTEKLIGYSKTGSRHKFRCFRDDNPVGEPQNKKALTRTRSGPPQDLHNDRRMYPTQPNMRTSGSFRSK